MSSLEKTMILIAIVALTAAGDYALKLASEKHSSFASWQFFLGTFLYATSAAGWVLLMKHHTLAQIGALYTSVTIIVLAVIGKSYFGETITNRQIAGLSAAIASVWLSA